MTLQQFFNQLETLSVLFTRRVIVWFHFHGYRTVVTYNKEIRGISGALTVHDEDQMKGLF